MVSVYVFADPLENSSMFVFNLERSDIPILSTQVAYNILYYIENGTKDKTGEVGLDYYNAFYDALSNFTSDVPQRVSPKSFHSDSVNVYPM